MEFLAKFCFSVGSIYKAPPLLVKTVLTFEESKGKIRCGRGEKLDKEGNCKSVRVTSRSRVSVEQSYVVVRGKYIFNLILYV